MNFKLVPVDTQTVLRNFQYLTEGIESLLQSVPDRDWDSVTRDLLNGRLQSWLGFEEGKYVGFATTQVERISDKLSAFWIIHTFIKKGSNRDLFLDGLKIFEAKAKEVGCTWVKFMTTRDKAFERRLPDYKPCRTEFIKEV